jgi:hypothetical protein
MSPPSSCVWVCVGGVCVGVGGWVGGWVGGCGGGGGGGGWGGGGGVGVGVGVCDMAAEQTDTVMSLPKQQLGCGVHCLSCSCCRQTDRQQ